MGNDPLFFNKIAAALLIPGVLAGGSAFVARLVFHEAQAGKQAYVIAEGEAQVASAPQTASKPAGPGEISPMLVRADVKKGKRVAKKCASCHTFDKGGKNRIGPNLWNVVGAKPASVAGFGFSSTLKGLGGAWGYEELNRFLYKPRDYAKGTKMSFPGLNSAPARADLIAYLRSLSDSPKAMP